MKKNINKKWTLFLLWVVLSINPPLGSDGKKRQPQELTPKQKKIMKILVVISVFSFIMVVLLGAILKGFI